MQLVTLRLGGDGLVFAPDHTARLPFQFAAPASGAYAILQGTRFSLPEGYWWPFSLVSHDGDVEVRTIEVELLTLFDPLQSSTSGQVEVRFHFPRPTFPASLIEAEIRVLVTGV